MNDNELIEKLGGVNAIADFFKWNKTTVHNWTRRGIPSQVKVDYPHIFMPSNINAVKPLEKKEATNV